MNMTDFTIQCVDGLITSNAMHELKDKLDADYKYLAGMAISDVHCSKEAILNQIKIKGIDLLPEDFEVAHIISSEHIAPNERFYTLFEPVEIRADEIVIKFTDSKYAEDYNLQIHLLLTNQKDHIQRVVLA
jgi:hypothetical protein